MMFNDDEQICSIRDVPDNNTSVNSTKYSAGRTKLSIISKPEAPLEKTEFKVLLELTGDGPETQHGLDLVAVLDISGSMYYQHKLDKLKSAMHFVIRKLRSIDRLSVITFSHNALRLCRLRKMTEASKGEIEKQINSLRAHGSTNMTDGLKMGLKVLSDRKFTDGRTVGIILMSDGEQNDGGDAAQVHVGMVPVFTFGFGTDHEPKVLKAIADNSIEGTFSDVHNTDNLISAFSQCLAGQLTVVVHDLKLAIKPFGPATIQNIYAGDYPQVEDKALGSVEVSFGNLYDTEVRNVLVHLLLPAVFTTNGQDILSVSYKYRYMGEQEATDDIVASVQRRETAAKEEAEEIILEELRIQITEMLKEAREKADAGDLGGAKQIIVKAQNLLENAPDTDNSLIEMLMSEVDHFLDLLEDKETYKTKGHPYALSAETSHNRQRFAVRGHEEKTRLYSTPRMDTHKKQVHSFVNEPHKPLPTAEDDLKHALSAKRFG